MLSYTLISASVKITLTSSATTVERDSVVALLRVTDDKVYRYHLSARRGLIPRGYIEAGSNQVTYPQQRFG